VNARIGFGTAALGRSISRSERVRVLETALECGLTHFDTAPLYGAGAAEEALAALPRDRITIATKAGYRAPSLARLAAGRLVKRPATAESGLFGPAELRASLEGSLRRLRTSHVDLLLLHDVRADDVGDALLEELDAVVHRGDARATGVATGWAEASKLLERGAPFPAVVQTSAEPEPPVLDGRRLVLHSAVTGRAGSPPEVLAALAQRRPDALLLFGSRNPQHVRETAAAVV
jgi:aryl-alcohol dehydrogenase-like predicted oxidoreductase